MSKGIMINGAAGTGKTTLGKELAKQLGVHHIDLDDYWWRWDTEIPYTAHNTGEKYTELVTAKLSESPFFVMSGTIGSILWNLVNLLFDLAVLLIVPVEIRNERIYAREFEKYGERILAGGDMHKHYSELLEYTKLYDTVENHSVCLKRHERWAAELLCPVLRVDGTKPISENVAWLVEQYLLTQSTA